MTPYIIFVHLIFASSTLYLKTFLTAKILRFMVSQKSWAKPYPYSKLIRWREGGGLNVQRIRQLVHHSNEKPPSLTLLHLAQPATSETIRSKSGGDAPRKKGSFFADQCGSGSCHLEVEHVAIKKKKVSPSELQCLSDEPIANVQGVDLDKSRDDHKVAVFLEDGAELRGSH